MVSSLTSSIGILQMASGGYGAPPGGGGFGPGGAPGAGGAPGGDEVNLTTPLVLSILSFFCGCGLLAGIPGFFVYQAKQLKDQGQVAEAQAKASLATKIAGAMVGVMVVIWLLYVVLMVVGVAAGS
jgi:hypothetical protein